MIRNENIHDVINPMATGAENRHKTIYLDFVFDANAYVVEIFKHLYLKWLKILDECKRMKQNIPRLKIYYGITIFNEKSSAKLINTRMFTDDEEDLKKAIERIAFKSIGENEIRLNEALKTSVTKLESHAPKNAVKGVVYFARMPKEVFPDFSNDGTIDCAKGYLYKCDYCPVFDLRDADQSESEVFSLQDFLNDHSGKMVKELVGSIVEKVDL